MPSPGVRDPRSCDWYGTGKFCKCEPGAGHCEDCSGKCDWPEARDHMKLPQHPTRACGSWGDPIEPQPEGVKYDADKPRYDLIPWESMDWVARVMAHGAKKYSDDNWKKIPNIPRRYFSAMMRHVMARWRGERLDPESGLPHLAHAVCCLLFWLWDDFNNE